MCVGLTGYSVSVMVLVSAYAKNKEQIIPEKTFEYLTDSIFKV